MGYSDPKPQYPIVPRERLDFDLDGDIPRFWFDGNPFKTRFFDAMSTLFPEGEKFFINCVRDYRERITDPKLVQEVKAFTRQEGQHTMVHNQFNERLKAQGIDVDGILRREAKLLNNARRVMPAVYTLGQTAAVEHITAIMAHGFFDRREVLEHVDARVRAMYAWHAIEEIEHKAVAFDVLKQVAKAGYFVRILSMLVIMVTFPLHVFLILNHMLKRDGFNFRQRTGLWLHGLWWLYGPRGLFPPVMGHLFAYLKPGFHPWNEGPMRNYELWLDTFNRTGDPIAAGNALHAAGS